MSRDKPILRAIKLLTLIESHPRGLRVTDMAEQLGAPVRAVCRDLDVLQSLPVPLFTDSERKILPTSPAELKCDSRLGGN